MSWTDIPDSALEPNKPIRAVDGLALRDNPIAIANGDPGAPRIKNAAYESGSITADKFDVEDVEAWIWFDRPAGGVGTMGLFLYTGSEVSVEFGDTVAGSTLNPSGIVYDDVTSSLIGPSGLLTPVSIAGTWRCLGMAQSSGGTGGVGTITLFLRIA